jgi:Domain of unknown function (DUF4129)
VIFKRLNPRLELSAAGKTFFCAGLMLWAACGARGAGVADTASSGDASHPMSLEAYKAELNRVEQAIENQRDHFQPPPGHAESLNVELPEVWYVEAQGQRFEVPTSELKIYLEDNAQRPTERKVALNADIARIRALAKGAEKLESARGAQPADAAHGKLKEILSRSGFNRAQERKSWIGELWEKFVLWVEGLLDRLFNAVSASRPVRNMILYGVIVIGFIALGWILIRVLGGVARRENLRLEPPAFPVKTSSQWAREAVAAAGRGDYREAIRCGYWAGVYRLSEIGILELDPSRTPREYLRLLSASRPSGDGAFAAAAISTAPVILADPAVRAARTQALSALTRNFESVWYADVPATEQDFTSAVAELEKLECRLPSTAPTAGW